MDREVIHRRSSDLAPELVEALFFPKLARPSTRHPQRQSIFDLLPYYDCLLTMHGKDLIFLLIAALMGWVIGMCAEILVPGKAPRSFVGTTLVGVGGAISAHSSDVSLAGGIAAKFPDLSFRWWAHPVAGDLSLRATPQWLKELRYCETGRGQACRP